VDADPSFVPDDIEALKAGLIAARAETAAVGTELASARAATANDRSLIAYLKLEIEKLRRVIYGPRAERTARLLTNWSFSSRRRRRRKTSSPPNKRNAGPP
jgi:transposase